MRVHAILTRCMLEKDKQKCPPNGGCFFVSCFNTGYVF